MAKTKTPLVTGERVVVAVVVSRVILSPPLSLISHGFSLFLLCLFAFLVEIRAETSPFLLSRFSPRRGASSGILLGAVTLPSVMLSKLVQLTRAISLHEAEQDELSHVTMQYWAASASCCAILIYLSVIMSQAKKTESLSSSLWLTRVSLTGTVFYGVACFVSLSMISHTAVKLIRHLLCTFPSCASIGEALLVTSGLVLYFGDFLACTIAKICENMIPVDLVSISYGIKRTETGIIVQGLLLGLLLFPMVFRCVVHIYETFLRKRDGGQRNCSDAAKSILFFVSLVFFMVLAVPSWMQFVHDFHQHPFLWVLTFVFSEPLKRISLCIYWVLLIVVSVSRFYSISRSSKVERILLRKYYHLMAVLMFLPALVLQPKFLDLAFGAALAVFVALEIIRICCFVRGCDASLLIDAPNSEKTAGPNGSVREFALIDQIKAQLEAACPSTVSCADIITLATRDSVALAGGPSYSIPTGRRDGLVSNDVDVALPGPTISVAGAVSLFTDKGMNVFDAVALIGAHTVGKGNCGLFSDRFTNFQGTGRPDPAMDPALVSSLRNTCANSATASLDQSTPLRFDNQFFKQLRKKRGVFQVDQRLATDRQTRGVVARYANNNAYFKRQFVRAMIKMGAVDVLTGSAGQIRRNCRRFN